ncbi:MAG TPA: DNA gyrase C-terminal beta-propeller domain-containing protein, partial [Ktedonobacteraceae bacterium]|nr:DNA gyrase C-terminal beta-propeller domain-containing protein [Ktedonobacteraceae bacterium]
VNENGYGKRTPVDEYPSQSRGGSGVITSKVTVKTGPVASARVITEKDNDLMIISAGGVVIRTDVSKIHIAGRATQGVRLMNLGEGDSVVAVATTNGKKIEEPDDTEDELEISEEEGDMEVSEEQEAEVELDNEAEVEE